MSRWTAAVLLLATVMIAPASAQDIWKLDDSIKELTKREQDDLKKLPDLLKDLPKDVMKAFLKEETKHLESLADEELEAFQKEAKLRLKANGPRHLLKTLTETLADLKVRSKRVLAIAYKEELKRFSSFDDRIINMMLAEAFKRVIADRLKRFNYTKLDIIKWNSKLNGPKDSYGWKSGTFGDLGSDNRVIKDLVVLAKEDKFIKTLFEREIEGSFGKLQLKAAKVEGLAAAKVGKLSFKDEFGKIHEGLGARFVVKTKFTVASAHAESKRLHLLKDQPVNISAMLLAKVVDIASNAELNSTNVISKDGLIMHNELTAGATASSSVRVPIDFDFKLFKVRLTPYAEVTAGVGAKAHFNFEATWEGRLSVDVGAAYSLGVGTGAGLRLEIMAGPLIQKILKGIQRELISFFRPIIDSFKGVREFGTAFESGKTAFTLKDLQASVYKDTAVPASFKDSSPQAVAMRYAPIIYQRVKENPHDYFRAMDFDGDFNGRNNWDNSKSGSKKAYVYYDVKETSTHYYIHYSWFYARREASGLSPLRFITRHENDTAGVMVMVRKNAPRGRHVDLVVTADGWHMHAYSPDKGSRWDTKGGKESLGYSGNQHFIDEADHPAFDIERTHAQVYVKARSHELSVYNGRDDRDAFEGDDGVVYFPTGTAEEPESTRDGMVGYALKPMQELLDQANDTKAFSKHNKLRFTNDLVLPKKLSGKVGPNNSAYAPWAYGHEELETGGNPRDRTHDRVTVVENGAMFFDPARVIASKYKVPGEFGRSYLKHDQLPQGRGRIVYGSPKSSSGASSEGASGKLRRKVGGRR